MVFRTLSILSVVVFRLCVTEKLDLAVPTCKRNSADYSSCLKKAINEAWPLFVQGLPEFDFPTLDPLFYDYQSGVYNNGDLHAEVIVSNVTIVGFEATSFMTVRPHFINNVFRLEIEPRIPRVLIDGEADAHGSIGGFRIGGKGHFNLTVEDIRPTWDISGPVKNDTWIVEQFRITPIIRSFKINLNNFFDGNRIMNELITMFVNENWPPLYRVTLPVVSDDWNTRYSNLLNRLFSKLSFSKVFP